MSKQFSHQKPRPPVVAESVTDGQKAALAEMTSILEQHPDGFKGEVLREGLDVMAPLVVTPPVVKAPVLRTSGDDGPGGGGGGSPRLDHNIHKHQSFMKEGLPERAGAWQGAGHSSTPLEAPTPKLRAGSVANGGHAGGGAVAVSGGGVVPYARNVSVGDLRGAGQCTVLKPQIIIYNRIPKCASGSMNIFIEEAKMKREGTEHHVSHSPVAVASRPVASRVVAAPAPSATSSRNNNVASPSSPRCDS